MANTDPVRLLIDPARTAADDDRTRIFDQEASEVVIEPFECSV